MRMKFTLTARPRAHPEYAPHERRGALAGRPGGTPRKADGAAWPGHARHLLECSHARLLRRRRLRVPPGEQPPVSDGHRSAGDDSGADAGKHQRGAKSCSFARPTRGASTGRATASRRTKPRRESGIADRDDRRSVRRVRGRDVLATSASGAATGEHERFFAALADGRARLSLLLEPQVSADGAART